jgi:hypothetical protein
MAVSRLSARGWAVSGDRCKDGASARNVAELSTKEGRGVKSRIAIVEDSRV